MPGARHAIASWLLDGPALVRDGPHAGAVAGVVGTSGTIAYVYPEIAGYYLQWLAWRAREGHEREPAQRSRGCRAAVAARLARGRDSTAHAAPPPCACRGLAQRGRVLLRRRDGAARPRLVRAGRARHGRRSRGRRRHPRTRAPDRRRRCVRGMRRQRPGAATSRPLVDPPGPVPCQGRRGHRQRGAHLADGTRTRASRCRGDVRRQRGGAVARTASRAASAALRPRGRDGPA